MKYIISGYIGFDNFGDEAIAHVLTQKLKQNGAEKITLISSNHSRTSKLHDTDSCGMFKFLPVLIDSDVLISGGGSLLQDVTSLKSLLYYLGVIFTALIFGKKVEIFAQGIGPINSKFGQMLTKFLLKRVNKITVRDIESQNLLMTWGIKSELVNDPILDLDLPQKNLKGIVGIQLRSFPSLTQDFVEKLAVKVAEKFRDKKIEVISLQDSADLEVCRRFTEKLIQSGFTNVELKSNLTIQDSIDTISNLEYLIAMRFHANIIGIKSGVKTIAINYDPKVKTLAQRFNLPLIELDEREFSMLGDI